MCKLCHLSSFYTNPCFIGDKKKYQQFLKKKKNKSYKNGFVTEHEIKNNIRSYQATESNNGVMVGVLASSVVDRGFDSRSLV
jgi:hypothetical protein